MYMIDPLMSHVAGPLASKNHIADLCRLPRLIFRGHQMKIPHAPFGILEINYEKPPASYAFYTK